MYNFNIMDRCFITKEENLHLAKDRAMNEIVVKSSEELLRSGGRFYNYEGNCYCDGGSSSWKLVPDLGFVKLKNDGTMPYLGKNPPRMPRKTWTVSEMVA